MPSPPFCSTIPNLCCTSYTLFNDQTADWLLFSAGFGRCFPQLTGQNLTLAYLMAKAERWWGTRVDEEVFFNNWHIGMTVCIKYRRERSLIERVCLGAQRYKRMKRNLQEHRPQIPQYFSEAKCASSSNLLDHSPS